MYKYAYIVGILLIVPIWIIIYNRRLDLRRPMMTIGFYVGALTVLTDYIWFLKDYWNPLIHINYYTLIWQDFLLGFFLGGVLSICYEFIFHKKILKYKLNIKAAFILLSIILFPFVVFTNIYKFNSIYSSIIGLVMGLFYILIKRKYALINSLISGLISLFIALIIYSVYKIIFPNIFKEWWYLPKLSGIYILQIPVEELLWFISFGLITGPLYTFLHKKDSNIH